MKQWDPSLLQIQAIIPMYLLNDSWFTKPPERERERARESSGQLWNLSLRNPLLNDICMHQKKSHQNMQTIWQRV